MTLLAYQFLLQHRTVDLELNKLTI